MVLIGGTALGVSSELVDVVAAGADTTRVGRGVVEGETGNEDSSPTKVLRPVEILGRGGSAFQKNKIMSPLNTSGFWVSNKGSPQTIMHIRRSILAPG